MRAATKNTPVFKGTQTAHIGASINQQQTNER